MTDATTTDALPISAADRTRLRSAARTLAFVDRQLTSAGSDAPGCPPIGPRALARLTSGAIRAIEEVLGHVEGGGQVAAPLRADDPLRPALVSALLH